MIFSEKIYKIANGYNPTLYSINSNKMNLYIFQKNLKKYSMITNSKIKIDSLEGSYNFNFINQLDGNYICACKDGNMSVCSYE